MARSTDALCAGGCGKLLPGGKGSLPPGRRTCHACRRKRREREQEQVCCICETTFVARATSKGGYPGGYFRRTCSRECYQVFNGGGRRPEPGCEECAVAGQACGFHREARRLARWQRKNLRRRGQGADLPLSVVELGERDVWRCHICRRRVNPELRWPHPRSPSRDHLIPIADRGSNDPENLALAHLRCNVLRNTGGTVQLRLVG